MRLLRKKVKLYPMLLQNIVVHCLLLVSLALYVSPTVFISRMKLFGSVPDTDMAYTPLHLRAIVK